MLVPSVIVTVLVIPANGFAAVAPSKKLAGFSSCAVRVSVDTLRVSSIYRYVWCWWQPQSLKANAKITNKNKE